MEHEKLSGNNEKNLASFDRWSGQRKQQAMVFGLQNGIDEKDIGKYVVKVFKACGKINGGHFAHKEELFFYHAAANLLSDFQTTSTMHLLKFEEDREIHLLIQEMEEAVRIPFILLYFHSKPIEDISKIMKKDIHLLNSIISESFANLSRKLAVEDDRKVLKRLELVNKSYSRIPFEFNELGEEEAQNFKELVPFPSKPVKKAVVDKKPLMLLGSVGLLLAGVISSTFFMADPNSEVASPAAEESAKATDAMIKEWQQTYDKARSSSPSRLGVEPEVFNHFEYVKEADQLKKRTFSKNNIEQLKNNPEEMQRQLDLLLLKIETPKEMLAMLQNMYLTGDELEQVIDDYADKTKMLIFEGNAILNEHEAKLSDIVLDGAVYLENLLSQKKDAPAEVKELIGSLQERGLTVIRHPVDDRFILRRNMEPLYGIDHLNNNYFVNLFWFDPYFDEDGLLIPVEEVANALPQVESVLIEEKVDSKKFEEFAHVFQHAFWLLLKGDLNQQVFDESGIVREDYQLAWKNLGYQTNHPLLFVMLPILEEMEASGWTKSESYNQLAYNDIMDALMLEKDGELSEKLPNNDVTIETEHVSADEFYTPAIEELYLSFAEGYDKERLRGVTPLDVYRLFQYANLQQDPVVMWHLMSEDKPSLEEYTVLWRQQPDFAEQIHYMEVPKEALHRIGKNFIIYPNISYKEEESMMMYHPELVTGENHTWKVRSHLHETYYMSEEADGFKKEVESLYTVFSADLAEAEISTASPGEIGGLFLLAAEKKDYDMVKALTFENQEPSIGILEAQLESRGIPGFSDTAIIKFSNETNRDYTGDFSSGSLWFQTSGGAENEILYNQLYMTKTPSGWRIADLNKY